MQYGKNLKEVVRANQKIDTDKLKLSEEIIQQLLNAGCKVLIETKFEFEGENKPLKKIKEFKEEKPSALELVRERRKKLDKEKEFLTQDNDLSVNKSKQTTEEKKLLKEIFNNDEVENSKVAKLETDSESIEKVSKKKRGRPKKEIDKKENI